MSHPVWSLTVPADVLVKGRSPHNFRITLHVTSHSTAPLKITVSDVSRTMLARQHPISAADVSFSKKSFTIGPGQTIREVVTFRLPASDTGAKVTNVMFSAQPIGDGLKVRPSVATAVHLRLSGPTTTAEAAPVPSVGPREAAPAQGGISGLAAGGIVLALLAAAVGTVLVLRHRRHAHPSEPLYREHPDR